MKQELIWELYEEFIHPLADKSETPIVAQASNRDDIYELIVCKTIIDSSHNWASMHLSLTNPLPILITRSISKESAIDVCVKYCEDNIWVK